MMWQKAGRIGSAGLVLPLLLLGCFSKSQNSDDGGGADYDRIVVVGLGGSALTADEASSVVNGSPVAIRNGVDVDIQSVPVSGALPDPAGCGWYAAAIKAFADHYTGLGGSLESFNALLDRALVFLVADTTPGGGGYAALGACEGTVRAAGFSARGAFTLSISRHSIPPPAGGLKLTATAASETEIDLSWNNLDGETSSKIEISDDGQTYRPLATLVANTTSYSSKGLTASTTYYYRLTVLKGSDVLATATASATTLGAGSSGGTDPCKTDPTSIACKKKTCEDGDGVWTGTSCRSSHFRPPSDPPSDPGGGDQTSEQKQKDGEQKGKEARERQAEREQKEQEREEKAEKERQEREAREKKGAEKAKKALESQIKREQKEQEREEKAEKERQEREAKEKKGAEKAKKALESQIKREEKGQQ